MGRCKICGQVNGHADGCPNSGNDLNGNNSDNYRGGEIRCSFCQTINPPGSKKCRGCSASLEGSVIRDYGIGKNFRSGNTMGEVSEIRQPTQKEENSEIGNICPICGYPLRCGSDECPQCHGKSQKKEKSKKNDGMKSEAIWNIDESKFRIGLCDKNGEISDAKTYENDDIVLGREELLPGNNNICRQHIHITNENGRWYVEDVSSTHQTFLIVKEKTPIEDGDVLVLGNKFFRFKTD